MRTNQKKTCLRKNTAEIKLFFFCSVFFCVSVHVLFLLYTPTTNDNDNNKMEFNYLSVSKEIKKKLDAFTKQHPDTPIITRFPPAPSGQLHLGHVKALSINYTIAKAYKGKMIMRIDNT